FGLEIELWRIGNSSVAPKFNVVCKPNDWNKTVAAEAAQAQAEGLSEAKQLQLEFWRAFWDYVTEHGSIIKPRKPQAANWMDVSPGLGRTGFRLAAVASFRGSTADESDESHE